MNIEEVKQELETRLAKIMVIDKEYKAQLNDPILSKHAQGYIDAISGTRGEQKFLEKMIDMLK